MDRLRKSSWTSRRGCSPGSEAILRAAGGGWKMLWKACGGGHNPVWTEAYEMKQDGTKGHSNFIMVYWGSENQPPKSIIRRTGQINCFPLGTKKKRCALLCILVACLCTKSKGGGLVRKLTHEGCLVDCSAWNNYCFEIVTSRTWKSTNK